TPTPARPTAGRRPAPATITMPTSTAMSTRTPATAGSNTHRAAGRTRPALLRGATRNRKRAAKVIVAGAVEAAPGVAVGTAPAVAASVVLVAADVSRISLAAADWEARV